VGLAQAVAGVAVKVYAEGTTVPVERSRAEIDSLLTRAGATSTAILNDEENSRAVVGFTIKGARFRIELPLPTEVDARRIYSSRWTSGRVAQMRRERWRALLQMVKMKIEVVRIGISTFEREFMADMVLPGGSTMYEAMGEAIRRGLDTSALPKLLASEAK
jgi:hypothetical protein